MPDIDNSHIVYCILTLNEEIDLPHCLSSIPPGSNIAVVDSGSTDATLTIAEAAGATIFHNPWQGFSAQRNYALGRLAAFQWVMFLDADERLTPELTAALAPGALALYDRRAYYIASNLYFSGKRLRFAPGYPVFHPRLVSNRPFDDGVFVPNDHGHGEAVRSDLTVGYLQCPYDHFFFDGNIRSWMEKHLTLADIEANSEVKKNSNITLRMVLGRLSPSGYPRAFLRFTYHYVLRLGFLDGKAGFLYSVMYFWYEISKAMLSGRDSEAGDP